MKNISKTSKIFLVITFISYALWLGSYCAKNMIYFQFFDPETMVLRSIFEKTDFISLFFSIYPIVTLNIICYVLFIIFFFAFVITSKLNLRNNGWLFISMLVIVITLPVEVYLIFKYDWNFIFETNNLSIQAQPALDLIKQRVAKFGMYSFISIFSTISIVFFFIFRPLTKNEN